ncbi:hypothetical protein ONO84_24805, partial [Salmonella enterica subsp. enterica serovar Virginia]|nr:hypothetical protein [Salmonella enterica subsp. enterica serovar Virginia]
AIGAWSQAMITLALVLTALLFCVVIGLPMGIWLARSPRAAKMKTGFPAAPATLHVHAINCVPVHRSRMGRTPETGRTLAEWGE